MPVIAWLVLSHLVGDFLLQTEYEALHKAEGSFWNRALWQHCLKYTAAFVPAVVFLGLNPWWLALLLGSHLVLDRRWFVAWWRGMICGSNDHVIKRTFWLTVIHDQTWHFIVLVVIAACGA